MVNVGALIGNHSVGIEFALLLVESWVPCIITLARDAKASIA